MWVTNYWLFLNLITNVCSSSSFKKKLLVTNFFVLFFLAWITKTKLAFCGVLIQWAFHFGFLEFPSNSKSCTSNSCIYPLASWLFAQNLELEGSSGQFINHCTLCFAKNIVDRNSPGLCQIRLWFSLRIRCPSCFCMLMSMALMGDLKDLSKQRL